MPASTTSVFSAPDDFRAALRNEGSISLFVLGRGRFLARLTKVDLYLLRLAAAEEHLPRIGFLAVPADMVVVSFPLGDRPAPIYGGIRPSKGEIMTFAPGHRLHVRTEGPGRWGAIWIPVQDFADYFKDLTESTLTIPSHAQLWRPPLAIGRRLLQLHAAAIRAAEVRPETIVDADAAHGMEQQLIEVLVECLSAGPLKEKAQISQRHQGIAARFEDLLHTEPDWHLQVEAASAAIGVSDRLLRRCCTEDLGMSPTSYIRLRALHRVYSILRAGVPGVTSVSQVARRYGFHDLGRFAATYRSFFGELPSATLKRHPHGQVGHPASGGARLDEVCDKL
jgi:AraC-like DNA-binding protein